MSRKRKLVIEVDADMFKEAWDAMRKLEEQVISVQQVFGKFTTATKEDYMRKNRKK